MASGFACCRCCQRQHGQSLLGLSAVLASCLLNIALTLSASLLVTFSLVMSKSVICWPLFSCSVFAYQHICVASLLSYSLPGNLSLSLLIRMWVSFIIYPVHCLLLMLTSFSHCLCLLGCKCSVYYLLTSFLLCLVASVWAPFFCPIFCLLTSSLFLLARMWVQSLIYPVHCLIISLLLCLCLSACECSPLFICSYHTLPADPNSPVCKCFPHLFYFSIC